MANQSTKPDPGPKGDDDLQEAYEWWIEEMTKNPLSATHPSIPDKSERKREEPSLAAGCLGWVGVLLIVPLVWLVAQMWEVLGTYGGLIGRRPPRMARVLELALKSDLGQRLAILAVVGFLIYVVAQVIGKRSR